MDAVSIGAGDVPKEAHAIPGELVEVQRMAAHSATHMRRCEPIVWHRERRRRNIEEMEDIEQPVEDVFSAIAPGGAAGGADRVKDLASTRSKLFRNLRSGLSAANHQHRARRYDTVMGTTL